MSVSDNLSYITGEAFSIYNKFQILKHAGSNYKAEIMFVYSSYTDLFFSRKSGREKRVVLFTSIRSLVLFVCLFDSLRPINNLSVKQGRVFLG